MRVLVANLGSTSFKYKLYDMPAARVLARGGMDRIGGIYSVSVPGAVAGWFTLLEEYGTMAMAEVLKPAIYYAEHGFHVTERIGEAWAGSERKLLREPPAAAT